MCEIVKQNTIKKALFETYKYIENNKLSILCESDFERHLSNIIADNIKCDNLDVHTQIPWYNNDASRHSARVDIVILQRDKYEKSNVKNKGYKNDSDAIAIEVKYYKRSINKNHSGIDKDIKTLNNLIVSRRNLCYYIILLESNSLFEKSKEFLLKKVGGFNPKIRIYLLFKDSPPKYYASKKWLNL
ncbi:hypothetical protein [Parabacteroides sp. PF5-6]|uniref:hypothetical protein n=1 Tax=Parabacteroides sp. PF5-6 TaxID=1742403 RepID=UPI0024058B83|nr:hypothetical protein [Parabacteroides sp. PF5-6]MDF9830035.1 hypothetical protein [Parabacteroides sp. PF5-6]